MMATASPFQAVPSVTVESVKAVVHVKLPNGSLSFTVTEETFIRRMTDMAAAELPFDDAEWWAEPLEEPER
jgi:hypothetical protein